MSDEYALLLADLQALCDQMAPRGSSRNRADQERTALFWRMGRRIVDVVQNGKDRGDYGKRILRQLSRDLSAHYGGDFSLRKVQYIRRFAIVYQQSQLQAGILWSHYRELLAIEDPATREALEKRIIAEKLSRTQLEDLIATSLPSAPFAFTPRPSSPGVFKVHIDPASGRPLLDLGFGILRDIPIRGLRHLRDGEYLTLRGEKFARVDCERGARYCWSGCTGEIIDGDTVTMRLSLGFDTFIDEKMRLRGVDAAERGTDAGKKAHRALTRLLKNRKSVTVITYSHDRYGRYVADLIADGVYVNKALVDAGAARFLRM